MSKRWTRPSSATHRERRRISALFEDAIESGRMSAAPCSTRRYQPIPGSNPQQLRSRFTDFTDAAFPAIQEALLSGPRMVFCVDVDRNGYLPPTIASSNKPQGGDVWRGTRRTAATAASSTTASVWRPAATPGRSCCRPTAATWAAGILPDEGCLRADHRAGPSLGRPATGLYGIRFLIRICHPD